MQKINNIYKYLKAFDEWEHKHRLNDKQYRVLTEILKIINEDMWLEWTKISNSELMFKTNISNENILIRNRNYLISVGLIEYKKGKKGSPGLYKLNMPTSKKITQYNLTCQNVLSIEQTKKSVKSETSEKCTDNRVYNSVYNQVYNPVYNDEKITHDEAVCEPSKHINNKHINNNIIKKEKEKKEKNAESVSPPSFNKQSEDILKLYNDNCTNLPKARQLSVKRNKQISLLFRRGYSLEDFQKVFENAQNSRFLCGENDRNWKANFDWLIIENNFLKALEGYYENFQTSSPPHKLEHKRSYNIEEYANYSIFDKVGESNYGNPNYHEYPEG